MAEEIERKRIEGTVRPFETIQIPGNETTPPIRTARTRRDSWFEQVHGKLRSEGTHWFDASMMIISNQMSQMLLLLPSCVAKLGWWRATLGIVIFGLLNCWTAHLVQFFYFRYYRSSEEHDKDPENNKVIQWNNLLSKTFRNRRQLKKLRMVGMGFNCVCLLTRSIIQLTYAVSIIYYINNKLEKRNWTYALASCCMIFAIVPTLRNYRVFSILGFVTATVAALTIAVASLRHQPVQGVKHSAESSSMWSLAWVWSTIVYAFGDTSASVQLRHENIIALKDIMKPPHKRTYKDIYVVSNLMQTDLHQIIQSPQPISDYHLQYFLLQILRGLNYLHRANILHRDLKPGNILVNANCDLKICDFGLARTNSTKDGQFMTEHVVTRWYCAPEVLLCCGVYNTAIDIWSVGCILAELLGRKAIFPGTNCFSQLKMIFSVLGTPSKEDMKFIDNHRSLMYITSLPYTPNVPLQRLYPTANPLAIDLLQRMLVLDPSKRIRVDELRHPYISNLYDPAMDDPSNSVIDLAIDENMGIEVLREKIWQEAVYHQ